MTWYEEKTDLKRACRFLRTKKNSTLKKQSFGGIVCIKFEISVYVLLRRCDFVVKVIQNGSGSQKYFLPEITDVI